MIYYRPTDGGPIAGPIKWRPRTVFLMQQLAEPVPADVLGVRATIQRVFKAAGFSCLDATAQTTGRDFLLKIWRMAVACPVGIAIVHEGISPATLANIYYELGLMQAYGRETAVVRLGRPTLPSDFVRTEYLTADDRLEQRVRDLVSDLMERAEHYEHMATQLENDPLLSIDYLRRAYLLTGQESLRGQAKAVFAHHGLEVRGLGSVERMLASF